MAFRKFKEIGEVLNNFGIRYDLRDFIDINEDIEAPTILKNDIDFVVKNLPYKISEASIGEMIIFPILKETWKEFKEHLMLWSHKSIQFSKELSGIPDYLIARQSKLGNIILDKPLLAVVEAKKDDFEGGWAQCALEMYTIQKINQNDVIPIFGIVSNGDNWEFGKLVGAEFSKHSKPLFLYELDELYAGLRFIMSECLNSIK